MAGPVETLRQASWRPTRVAVGLNVVVWILLAVTGLLLVRSHGGSTSVSTTDFDAARWETNGVPVTRYTHQLLGYLATVAAVALPVAYASEKRHVAARVSAVTVAAVFATALTGYLIPWTWLWFSSVTVGTNLSGFRPIFGDDVPFVILGQDVAVSVVWRWFVAHVAVLPSVVFLLGATSAWLGQSKKG